MALTFNSPTPPNTGNKKNLKFLELVTVLNSAHNGYTNAKSVKINGVHGWLYTLNIPLKENQKAWLEQWKNCLIFIQKYEFSPEIRSTAVFLADKAIKS